jgi:hypothetical protein
MVENVKLGHLSAIQYKLIENGIIRFVINTKRNMVSEKQYNKIRHSNIYIASSIMLGMVSLNKYTRDTCAAFESGTRKLQAPTVIFIETMEDRKNLT